LKLSKFRGFKFQPFLSLILIDFFLSLNNASPYSESSDASPYLTRPLAGDIFAINIHEAVRYPYFYIFQFIAVDD
jgi:hypothetical protein